MRESISVYSVSSKGDKQWVDFVVDNKLDFDNVSVPLEVYKDQNKATEYILKGLTDLKSLNLTKKQEKNILTGALGEDIKS